MKATIKINGVVVPDDAVFSLHFDFGDRQVTSFVLLNGQIEGYWPFSITSLDSQDLTSIQSCLDLLRVENSGRGILAQPIPR